MCNQASYVTGPPQMAQKSRLHCSQWFITPKESRIPFEGLSSAFRRFFSSFEGVCISFEGLSTIKRSSMQWVVCAHAVSSTAVTWEILLRRTNSLSRVETKKFSWRNHDHGKHNYAMPTTIFSANTRSERQSFQCLHLRQGTWKHKVTACRKRDREPSKLPCEVFKFS